SIPDWEASGVAPFPRVQWLAFGRPMQVTGRAVFPAKSVQLDAGQELPRLHQQRGGVHVARPSLVHLHQGGQILRALLATGWVGPLRDATLVVAHDRLAVCWRKSTPSITTTSASCISRLAMVPLRSGCCSASAPVRLVAVAHRPRERS